MYKKNLSALIAVIFITINAYSQNIKSFEQNIPYSKVNNVKALISIAGGKLLINGQSNDLALVKFSYNGSKWDPTVSYTENNETGKLIVKAEIDNPEKSVDEDNECIITLNKKPTYSIGLVLGAGIADIDLNNYSISRGLFRLGVGSFKVNLANSNISALKIEAGIGEAFFDLSGNRKKNLNATIKAGIGKIDIIVPENVGVKITVSGFLGDVDANNFYRDGKVYTNKAYNNTNVKMEFDITGAIGAIKITEK